MTNHRPPPPSLRVKYPIDGVQRFFDQDEGRAPSRSMNAIPKQKPEAMIPTMSEPCSDCTRGLPRLFRSTSAPHNAKPKPMSRLRFFICSPLIRIVYVIGKPISLRFFGNSARYVYG
jgi:hypothetical protein